MSGIQMEQYFTQDVLDGVFPPDRTDRFFDALFGDASEGAYAIRLRFRERRGDTLIFEFELAQRPGKCLSCSLTYGLPAVFTRHPVIDVKGVVKAVDGLLDGKMTCAAWELGATRERSRDLHVIPLLITLTEAP